MCVSVCLCVHGRNKEVRGHLAEVDSILLQNGF